MPGASTLATATKKALQSRCAQKTQEAQQILLEEIRAGKITPYQIPLEEPAAIMVRYARAVHEGVGRTNLRLLAAVLAGQLAQKSVYADEFYRWADILAGLTMDEIIVLAGYLRRMPDDIRIATLIDLGSKVYQDIYGPEAESWNDFEATRGALLRTGLLSISATGGAIGGGSSIAFAPTSKLQALGQLVKMDEVLGRSNYRFKASE